MDNTRSNLKMKQSQGGAANAGKNVQVGGTQAGRLTHGMRGRGDSAGEDNEDAEDLERDKKDCTRRRY